MLNNADNKLVDLYYEIRYEQKWRSLPLNEKLELIVALDRAFKQLREMNRSDEVNAFTPTLMMDHISQRGFRRTRRLLDFAKNVEKDRLEMQLTSDEGRTKKLLELKSKLRPTNLKGESK